MRIVYCIGSLDGKGGAERVLANKANYFTENLGYEVHILVNSHHKPEYAYEFSKKVVIHNMDITSQLSKPVIPLLSYKLLQRKMLPIYRSKIASIRPDLIVVVQHGIDDFIIPKIGLDILTVREFHYAYQANLAHAKLIANSFKRWVFLLGKQRIIDRFKLYDKLILLTESDRLSYDYKTDTYVIPNMVDLPVGIKQSPINTNNVISVGSMHDARKGFDVQIRLWKKIVEKYPDWCLNIYGDGPYRSIYQKLIDELGLSNNVFLRGNTDSVYEKYSESSLFICTSIAEGLPMVIIEAMACGLPIVSFDCPFGPKEIVRDNIDGFIVEMDDESQLFDKVEYAINNRDAMVKMGQNAKERSTYYSAENISKIWQNFFKSTLSIND